jgi:hypothetical protein
LFFNIQNDLPTEAKYAVKSARVAAVQEVKNAAGNVVTPAADSESEERYLPMQCSVRKW